MLLLLISSPFSYSQYLPPNVPADYLPAPSPSTEGILDVMAQRALIDPPSLLKRAVGRAILKTEGGNVLGTTSEEGIARFAAIPYAAPPIPRFRPPQPAKPWQGERNGTEFGARCYETYNPLYPPPSTRAYSEDCLFANVFTPLSAVGNPAAALPVLVWIHGGAYQAGSANDYDATKLVAKSGGAVCVVTINYRGGHLGPPRDPYLVRTPFPREPCRRRSQVETWPRRVRAADPAALTRPRGRGSLARLVRTRRRRARSRAAADPHCACRAVHLQSAPSTLQARMDKVACGRVDTHEAGLSNAYTLSSPCPPPRRFRSASALRPTPGALRGGFCEYDVRFSLVPNMRLARQHQR